MDISTSIRRLKLQTGAGFRNDLSRVDASKNLVTEFVNGIG